jgi:hypothetical protein
MRSGHSRTARIGRCVGWRSLWLGPALRKIRATRTCDERLEPRDRRVSSNGSENLPDRSAPGCCVPGRVHVGVLGAEPRRWHLDWSPVWSRRAGTGVAASVAGDRDRDGPRRSSRCSQRRECYLLGNGPGRQVHLGRPQPALRERHRVVPGSGGSDGDQRAHHQGRCAVSDELTSDPGLRRLLPGQLLRAATRKASMRHVDHPRRQRPRRRHVCRPGRA